MSTELEAGGSGAAPLLGLPTYTLEQGEKRLAMLKKWNQLCNELETARAAERSAMARRDALQQQMAAHHTALELLEDQMGEKHYSPWLDSLYGQKRLPPNAN